MNDYLHAKVFGLGEEISPNIDSVRRMNIQNCTESTQLTLKKLEEWLSLFKWIHSWLFSKRGDYILLRPCRSNWSERLQKLWCIAKQSGEDKLRYFKKCLLFVFILFYFVLCLNQRSHFISAAVNIALEYYTYSFICALVFKATTRGQYDCFKMYSYKFCRGWYIKSQSINLRIALNYSVASMASSSSSPLV